MEDTKQVLENNKLIAEFLNWEFDVIEFIAPKEFETIIPFNHQSKKTKALECFTTSIYKVIDLKFHSDWNWLMKVIEKIESSGYRVEIVKHICGIYLSDKEKIIISENIPKIEAVYNVCVEFIKWYNENKV